MKLQKKLALYLCTSLVIMTVLLLRTDRKVAASSSSCGSWSVVSSPNVKGNNSEFHAVAASSANNVWAVGDFYNTDAGTQSTLTEHWNGSKWSIVSSANIGSFTNVLHAVAVVSTSNVWAVGYTISSTTFYTQALIEHWNGSKWSTVSSPIIGTDFNELYAISAVSSNNVWAVGDYRDNNAPYAQTLIEHWNGSKWSVVSSPNIGNAANVLYGIAVVSTSNIWAVGYYDVTVEQTLTEHWNGNQWSIVSSPNVGSGDNSLQGVTKIPGSNQIWAVGETNSQTLIELWNGSQWNVVSSLNVAGIFYGVAAASTKSAWAVGRSANTTTLIEHWNGSQWNVVSIPLVSSSYLPGVAVVNGTSQAWAVGERAISNTFNTLTEFYC